MPRVSTQAMVYVSLGIQQEKMEMEYIIWSQCVEGKMLRNNYIKKEILLVQNQPCNILPITIISKEHFNIFWKIAFLLKLFSILFSKHFQALICFRVKIPWAVYVSILQAFSTIMTYNGTHRCIRKECNKLLP